MGEGNGALPGPSGRLWLSGAGAASRTLAHRRSALLLLLCALVLWACRSAGAPDASAPEPGASGEEVPADALAPENDEDVEAEGEDVSARAATPDDGVEAQAAAAGDVIEPEEVARQPMIDLARTSSVLYPADEETRAQRLADCEDPGEEGAPEAEEVASVTAENPDAARIRCMLRRRFSEDRRAAALAVKLFDRVGVVSGVERAHTSRVGWRGVIEFVPELPVGREREHMRWVHDGFMAIDEVLSAVEARAEQPVRFRWRALSMHFFRTVDRTTPSAHATRWWVGYNLSGSLLRSERKVRETLFHELFHPNDFDHGDWSRRELDAMHAELVERCTRDGEEMPSTRCLRPYAPGETRVRGGTYYAFYPGNGVGEYAAELGLRYFLEHRAALAGERVRDPFKCQAEENARAWALLVDEFFGGVDLVPPCDP